MKDNHEKLEEEISVEEDKYGGVILTVQKPMDSVYFATQLEDSISYWKQQGKKGMWINVPLLHSNLVDSAVKAGFTYDHAESDYLMLVYRFPDTSVSIPANASLGAFVVNNKDEVQEISGKFGGTGVRKMPTGVVDEDNREFALPLSLKDLISTLQEEKSLTSMAFMRYTRDSVCNIHPKYHSALLLLCGSFLGYQAKTTTAPFDLGFKKSTNAPPQSLLLTFGEALEAFFPEMTHITKFMLCYFLTLLLVCPLEPGLQIFCMLLLTYAPLFYFPELVRKASGVSVALGSFKLPLIWFATFGAVGLSLICGLVTLLMVYISWRLLYKGKPRVGEVEVSFDGLSEVFEGDEADHMMV